MILISRFLTAMLVTSVLGTIWSFFVNGGTPLVVVAAIVSWLLCFLPVPWCMRAAGLVEGGEPKEGASELAVRMAAWYLAPVLAPGAFDGDSVHLVPAFLAALLPTPSNLVTGPVFSGVPWVWGPRFAALALIIMAVAAIMLWNRARARKAGVDVVHEVARPAPKAADKGKDEPLSITLPAKGHELGQMKSIQADNAPGKLFQSNLLAEIEAAQNSIASKSSCGQRSVHHLRARDAKGTRSYPSKRPGNVSLLDIEAAQLKIRDRQSKPENRDE